MYIDGRIAECVSDGAGTNAVSVKVVQTLEKFWGLWIWTEVSGAKWTTTSNDCSIFAYNTKTNLPDGRYRLKSEFTFTDSSGHSEKITVYSAERIVGNG